MVWIVGMADRDDSKGGSRGKMPKGRPHKKSSATGEEGWSVTYQSDFPPCGCLFVYDYMLCCGCYHMNWLANDSVGSNNPISSSFTNLSSLSFIPTNIGKHKLLLNKSLVRLSAFTCCFLDIAVTLWPANLFPLSPLPLHVPTSTQLMGAPPVIQTQRQTGR